MTIFAGELGETSRLGKEGIPESLPKKFAKFTMGDEDQCSPFVFVINKVPNTHLI